MGGGWAQGQGARSGIGVVRERGGEMREGGRWKRWGGEMGEREEARKKERGRARRRKVGVLCGVAEVQKKGERERREGKNEWNEKHDGGKLGAAYVKAKRANKVDTLLYSTGRAKGKKAILFYPQGKKAKSRSKQRREAVSKGGQRKKERVKERKGKERKEKEKNTYVGKSIPITVAPPVDPPFPSLPLFSLLPSLFVPLSLFPPLVNVT